MSQFDLNLAVQQYTTNVQLLVQQEGSRLMPSVMVDNHYGKQAVAVDQYAATNANKVIDRYAPIVPADTQNDRRWVSPVDYDWADYVDQFDKLRLLNDPMSYYVKNGTAAMMRAVDDEIINAFFGTAKTGETGTTSTSFLSANQVSVDVGGTTSGLNVQKLITGLQILRSYDVDLDVEPVYCVIGSKQYANLMNEIQVVNADYNSTKVMVNGRVTSFLGINFIVSNRLPTNGSGYRRVPLYVKSAMHLGMWNDLQANVTKREDMRGQPWQVYLMETIGATRTEEKKIVELPCAES